MKKVLFLSYLVLPTLIQAPFDFDRNSAISPLQMIPTPAAEQSSSPYLFSNGKHLYMSWTEIEDQGVKVLKYSSLQDKVWEPAKEIHKGTNWFVNWADFPIITQNQGNLLTHTLVSSAPMSHAYDIRIHLQPQTSDRWKTDLPLHTDGTPTEHGFVSAQPYQDGFFVNWLDGRAMKPGSHMNTHGTMSLRAAFLDFQGNISSEAVLDERSCECCQTSSAITANGPVVVYRDRSENETRDISIVRLDNGQWTTPKTVFADHWVIRGCPVNGPQVAALGKHVAVTWFTMAGGTPKVQLIFSDDSGAHFDAPIELSTIDVVGRVNLAYIDTNTVAVSWVEQKDRRSIIKVMAISKAGQRSSAITIGETQVSGIPQIAVLQDKLYIAWTEQTSYKDRIHTAYIPLKAFEL